MQPKNTLQKHLTRDYQSMMTCMNTGNEFQHATRETPSVASGLFKDREISRTVDHRHYNSHRKRQRKRKSQRNSYKPITRVPLKWKHRIVEKYRNPLIEESFKSCSQVN